MLKIYTSLDAVPEALREHYALVDGRYVPQLADDHPVLTHNKQLLTEKSQATARVKELEADIETAKATTIPRGHVTVAKADAEALDKYKALGKVEDLTAVTAEHETLKGEVTKRQREDQLTIVAKDLGYDNVDAFKRLQGLPEFESRDGKWIAKVTDGKGVITEKPAQEFIESSPDIAPFLPALKIEKGVTFHGTQGSQGSQGVDRFAQLREIGKQHNESAQQSADLEGRFGLKAKAAS